MKPPNQVEQSETENAPRQIFKTIQKGRRQDSERCFKTGPQYVPKDGFQDFLQYVKSFIRRIHDQASGYQDKSSRLSLKNVFKASKAFTLQTSWKLEFYTVSRQVFKTVYKRRLRDVESVNYRCVFQNGLTHDPKIGLKIIYKGRHRDVYSVNSSRMVLNTFSRWIFKPIVCNGPLWGIESVNASDIFNSGVKQVFKMGLQCHTLRTSSGRWNHRYLPDWAQIAPRLVCKTLKF